MLEKIKNTASFLLQKIENKPEVGIILGSGLGGLVNHINIEKSFPYEKIPDFPTSTVEGHKGALIFGKLGDKSVVAMQGRFHYYEGYSMDKVTFPVRVMKYLGIKTLIVSNAAGGLNPDYNVGDLMIISDHINFFPNNPLLGPNNNELGTRFPDMSNTYNANIRKQAKQIAAQNNIPVREGVYIGSSGPMLETPAEYKMFRILGADATGMSTVPEVIAAHHMNIKCFGMSVITNVSNKVDPNEETTHEEVQNVAGDVEPKMSLLITEIIRLL
ncbi:MAG: purine-nucleoside phosphorylase [Chlorobi bacterium]|nr:purine-nucleoside phosphorylase [Chlorobiota bacterium]